MSQEEDNQKQEELQQMVLPNMQDQVQKRKNKKRPILNPSQITGHWSEKEHKTYLDFLNVHKAVMESSDQKKTSKIFKLMSETIGTRSPSQCRSHHQKFNPFLHQVKKRQKGAGRKKREMGTLAEKNLNNGFLDQQYFAQMLNQPFYIQQQMTADNQMLFPHFSLMMPFLDGINREDDKIIPQDQQMLIPPIFMNQPQFMDEKLYNFAYPHPQQIQVNFNYYQPMNEYYVNNSAEFLNKDPQSEEQ